MHGLGEGGTRRRIHGDFSPMPRMVPPSGEQQGRNLRSLLADDRFAGLGWAGTRRLVVLLTSESAG